jgi:hypothetical protein
MSAGSLHRPIAPDIPNEKLHKSNRRRTWLLIL